MLSFEAGSISFCNQGRISASAAPSTNMPCPLSAGSLLQLPLPAYIVTKPWDNQLLA